MCHPPGIPEKARLRTARRSVPAPFVNCVVEERGERPRDSRVICETSPDSLRRFAS